MNQPVANHVGQLVRQNQCNGQFLCHNLPRPITLVASSEIDTMLGAL